MLDQWIVEQRPPREQLDPLRPYLYFAEEERSSDAGIVPVNTIFLTNRECPWRCLMCDLWKNTLTETVPPEAITTQIAYALADLPQAKHIKLYNSGSFFDPRAIPAVEYPAIAGLLTKYQRVIVESHPSLIGDNCFGFRDLLSGSLEVAMGLETVHPGVLARLNKRMTLEQFSAAAALLRKNAIALRVFILVKPPFLVEQEALYWAQRSLDFAFDCGATAATLIPTRGGNGAMETLATRGDFSPPNIETLERSMEYGIQQQRGRVFVDLWDLESLPSCQACFANRASRLRAMNLLQSVLPPLVCGECR